MLFLKSALQVNLPIAVNVKLFPLSLDALWSKLPAWLGLFNKIWCYFFNEERWKVA